MKTIRTTKTASDAHWFVINGQECLLPWSWDTKVDIASMQYVSCLEDEWKSCEWPTLNDLKASGVDVKDGFPYTKYDIFLPNTRSMTVKQTTAVIKEFEANGFHVTLDALVHNYAAWKADFKSGYRGKDFHLFTPCGCNPLSFRATTLEPSCRDWQKTYIG